MAWKLIELQPLKPFFFGMHHVFTNTHYAKSEMFPQQTQLMGAIRLYWLEKNGLMRVQKDGKYVPYEKKQIATNLVGNASAKAFLYNKEAPNDPIKNERFFELSDNLGCILNLSPVFIIKKDKECFQDALFEIPSDIVEQDKMTQIAKPKPLTNIVSNGNCVLLEKFDVKKWFKSGFGGKRFWQEYVRHKVSDDITKQDAIFASYEQVGIALKDKKVQEEKFYTKRSYKLKPNYRFGFLIDIDEERLVEYQKEIDSKRAYEYNTLEDGIISIGADGSMFKLRVHDEIPSCIEEHPVVLSIKNPMKKEGKKVVLLSNAMLENSIDDEAFFQIVTHKIPFKMMKDATSKTEEHLLTPKGSIYYFDKPKAMPQAKGAYAKMGFNCYLTIN